MVYTVDGVQYTRRKKIILTGASSGALAAHQLKLTALWEAAMQADYDDARFTDADMQTLIDAWLESKTDSTTADIWAEFPTTPADGVEKTKAYMYYGNAGSSSDWNGENTFLQFTENRTDHFHMANTLSTPVVFFADISFADTTHSQKLGLADSATLANPVNGAIGYFHSAGNFYGDSTKASTRQALIGSTYVSTKERYEILWTSSVIKYWNAGNLDVTQSNAAYIPTASMGITLLDTIGALNGDPTMHFGAVRKYAANPPTAAFGIEEHQRRTPMMM